MLEVLNHPLITHKLTQMRNKNTCTKDFRENLDEIAELMAYEVCRDLPTRSVDIETPIGPCTGYELAKEVVIVPILRAGIGLLDGIRRLVPTAKVGFIGLYRDEETLEPKTYYFKLPVDVTEGQVVIVDPALATGGSADAAIDFIKKEGCTRIKFMCIFASEIGVKLLAKKHPDVHIYCARYIPGELDEHGYIPTAAGDAGDRINGTYSLKHK